MFLAQKDILITLFTTLHWNTIASGILTYIEEERSSVDTLHSAILLGTECSTELHEHYKYCVLYYSTEAYSLGISVDATLCVSSGYNQEKDTRTFADASTTVHTIPAETFACIPPKTPYIVSTQNPTQKIYQFSVPYYLLRSPEHTVNIQCFSMIQRFAPENAQFYPIELQWTLQDVIDSLGIETDIVRIVFVNDVATSKENTVIPQTKITLFPGIGGG